MKTIETIYNYLSEHYGLTLCDTTDNANGYPSGLRKAIYGFKTIDEAKEVAEELGGELGYIDKRDGWQVWHRRLDWDARPFTLNCEDLDYNFEADNLEDFEKIAYKEIQNCLDVEKTLDEINNLVEDIIFVKEMIDSLEDEQTVFFCTDGNFGASKIVDKECMSYYYDTKTTAIAVILDC